MKRLEELFKLINSKQKDEQLYIMKKEHEKFLWERMMNNNSISEVSYLYTFRNM